MTARCRRTATLLALLLVSTATVSAAQPTDSSVTPEVVPPSPTRNGREIYTRFREGLADPSCDAGNSARWRSHFATAPARLASPDNDVLPLFGYVVDALRAASLPTEYALIPFVESGYKPGARSASGPAGLWQMIAITARNHEVPMRAGYDGRLSPIDSTQAAVRYLKTLHGMFAGDWRLAVMAYNAGEYRVLGALKRSGQVARTADPEKLVSLSGISQAYVRKLHALSCLLDQADDKDAWMQSLDRPVPVLEAVELPSGSTLEAWSASHGRDVAVVRRLNPAVAGGLPTRVDRTVRVLAPMADDPQVNTYVVVVDSVSGKDTAQPEIEIALAPVLPAAGAMHVVQPTTSPSTQPAEPPPSHRHVVVRGESVWTIARHYKLQVGDLLTRNGLIARSVLRPGMVLKLDRAAFDGAAFDGAAFDGGDLVDGNGK